MCGFCSMFVLEICVLVFTEFCIVCKMILYCFIYVHVFLLVSSVLPPSDNEIAVSNNNNNKNKS
jgi:hypothetical protein